MLVNIIGDVVTLCYFVNSDECYLVAQSSYPHKGRDRRLAEGLLAVGALLVVDEADVLSPTKTLSCGEIVPRPAHGFRPFSNAQC